jgi:hypothetical protein
VQTVLASLAAAEGEGEERRDQEEEEEEDVSHNAQVCVAASRYAAMVRYPGSPPAGDTVSVVVMKKR